MKKRVQYEDPEVSYLWLKSEERFYIRNPAGDLRRVSENALTLLEKLASNDLEYSELPENASDLVKTLRREGYLNDEGQVVELLPPDDILLWPRIFLFVSLLTIGSYAALFELPNFTSFEQLFTPMRMISFISIALISLIIHECGHYFASKSYFSPEVRVGTINGIIPAVITETTGAWMLPRNRRLWINLAGPLVQCIWLQGLILLHYTVFSDNVVLSIAIVWNVLQIIFSLNPLIHGDGYWMFLDAFNIVDLRKRGIDDLFNKKITSASTYVVVSYSFSTAMFLLSLTGMAYLLGLID
ncbi:hypothetical protein [Halococcus sp. IIIV-5B]|uniref:hypothetical protein n=1 Tax=Halococcus sp. IIIV-5B TaxID=2321230 RepID=UPI0011C3BA01|nr:hypothetical protein [Halococcus sp. IIIV-5B]